MDAGRQSPLGIALIPPGAEHPAPIAPVHVPEQAVAHPQLPLVGQELARLAIREGDHLHVHHPVAESKPGPGGSVSLLLTPLELIERLAALIPPSRRHRHRYWSVLALNSPLRAAVTALAGAREETAASCRG